jgi:4-hydroxy-4-methyl-2-oxoglutarate aldolase
MANVETINARLLALGSATIGESGGCPLAAYVKPVWAGAQLAGPAFPGVCAPGDNLAIHVAVAEAPAGSVLAIDVGAVPDRGYFGEVLATASAAAGQLGLVIDGCVRDSGGLEAKRYPVFARGLSLPGTSKKGPGSVGTVSVVGGVTVHAGDWLVGDADGVVAIPAGKLETVLSAAVARAAKEQEMFDRLAAGSTTVELLGLERQAVTREKSADEKSRQARVISTAAAPEPSGSYEQARWTDDLVFLAGVGPYDPVTRDIVGADIVAQTEQAMANAGATLAATGLSFSSVVSCTVFLAELTRDWRAFDEVYRRFITPPYPARAVVGAGLKGILVEIVMVAERWR